MHSKCKYHTLMFVFLLVPLVWTCSAKKTYCQAHRLVGAEHGDHFGRLSDQWPSIHLWVSRVCTDLENCLNSMPLLDKAAAVFHREWKNQSSHHSPAYDIQCVAYSNIDRFWLWLWPWPWPWPLAFDIEIPYVSCHHSGKWVCEIENDHTGEYICKHSLADKMKFTKFSLTVSQIWSLTLKFNMAMMVSPWPLVVQSLTLIELKAYKYIQGNKIKCTECFIDLDFEFDTYSSEYYYPV